MGERRKGSEKGWQREKGREFEREETARGRQEKGGAGEVERAGRLSVSRVIDGAVSCQSYGVVLGDLGYFLILLKHHSPPRALTEAVSLITPYSLHNALLLTRTHRALFKSSALCRE